MSKECENCQETIEQCHSIARFVVDEMAALRTIAIRLHRLHWETPEGLDCPGHAPLSCEEWVLDLVGKEITKRGGSK